MLLRVLDSHALAEGRSDDEKENYQSLRGDCVSILAESIIRQNSDDFKPLSLKQLSDVYTELQSRVGTKVEYHALRSFVQDRRNSFLFSRFGCTISL